VAIIKKFGGAGINPVRLVEAVVVSVAALLEVYADDTII
jgi:hypothetical protein